MTRAKDPRQPAAKKGTAAPAPAAARRSPSAPPAPAAPPTHAHDAALSADKETREGRRRLGDDDPKVTVRIPRGFNLQVLTPDGSRMHRYEAGIDEMPLSHATHEYSAANGVEVVKP